MAPSAVAVEIESVLASKGEVDLSELRREVPGAGHLQPLVDAALVLSNER